MNLNVVNKKVIVPKLDLKNGLKKKPKRPKTSEKHVLKKPIEKK